jgi:RNA 2',3'-cyclic 3'-phosphodiesterase
MRVFVAVDLDERVRGEVGGLIQRLRSEARDDPSLRVSWVAPEQLHLTLHFLGNVDDAAVARLADRIAQPIELPAFTLSFGNIGSFVTRGRPHVIWLGVNQGSAPLIELHRVIGRRLQAVGCEPEERPYSPHLTLARIRQLTGTVPQSRRRRARGRLSPVQVPVQGSLSPMAVDRVTLYESQLGRGGATHIAHATGLLDRQPR